MMDAAQLQHHGLEAAATIRRAYAAFNQEMTEFSLAAIPGDVAQMEVARHRAHDHLDAYFDGIAAAHSMGQDHGRS